MIQAPPKIDLLPEHLIDQIKAGEVIERPGNLIKEILENAVDAGSTKLELIIKNNGLDLISLKDNGHGMRLNDLPLAFSRHATSKISRFEDLYKLHSFGFRGEALASIAAISKLQCISSTADAKTWGKTTLSDFRN
jgi:DNA mismatch repair protein MutL